MMNPWAKHVAARSTVSEMYEHLVAKGVLSHHPVQAEMAQVCTPLLETVRTGKPAAVEPAAQSCSASLPLSHSPTAQLWKRAQRSFVSLSQHCHKSLQRGSASKDVDVRWPENLGAGSPSRGLYLWGDVGIGKTLMMDLFELSPTPGLAKRRAHLHSFMTELNLRVHRVVEHQRKRPFHERRRPIEVVAEEIVHESPILCFDEFQTFDVAHASLLSAFFEHAFKCGIFLVTTSNKPPESLCLISSTFDDFVPLLRRQCTVLHCHGVNDFRKASRHVCHNHVFRFPNDEIAGRALVRLVESGLPGGFSWEQNATMRHFARDVLVPRRCGGVAIFHFAQLCGEAQALGPADFQLIASQFHTVLVLDVPQIGSCNRNVAKEFIVMIDEFYQHKVKLLMSTTVPWRQMFDEVDVVTGMRAPAEEEYYTVGEDERSGRPFESEATNASKLFVAREEQLSFGRVASRLHEMGSAEYLHGSHINFVITDFDSSVLVNIDDSTGHLSVAK